MIYICNKRKKVYTVTLLSQQRQSCVLLWDVSMPAELPLLVVNVIARRGSKCPMTQELVLVRTQPFL